MDEDSIILPRSEETALLKLEHHTSEERDLIRQTVTKLLDPENEYGRQVRELVIGSRSSSKYDDDVEADEDGAVDILGQDLNSTVLEEILRNLKELRTFSWFVNMPIPENVAGVLREVHRNAQLRYLKIQKTEEANVFPKLNFTSYDSFPSRQYFDRNDFGSIVYTSQDARRALRLQLLVPYYPVHEGDAKTEWLRRKIAAARSAIESLEGLTSVYATDYQGEIGLLVPALVKHGENLRVLKMHSIPCFEFDRPEGPSWLSTAEITLIASHSTSLTHLEMDFQAFDPGADRMIMPSTSPNPTLTTIAKLKSLRTLRLWIEVPISASVFQDAYRSSDAERPPLKESKLVQAVGNLYTLLSGANPALELDWFEVAFTRLDSWDRMDAYPRFLPVRLTPSEQSDTATRQEDGDVEASQTSGFTVKIGEWRDDYPEEDIGKLIDYAVGHIY
ncbi:hypothetical protein H2200_007472 [Cladophialophora chaetospira]|uniref:Uncharacterized protein n=1 Tax=Cladophialophora chaetospira TaxID=386627 RepID=A0AA38X803_9EURO|nr:hypothetical protein H2200_007472 [Cladophialophora chaetospira]